MRRLPQRFVGLRRLLKGLSERFRLGRRRAFARSLAPMTFRQLEPRRVLSVNPTLNAGVLDIVIDNNFQASLQQLNATDFFVDRDQNQVFSAGDFQGTIANVTTINVSDNSAGSFFWSGIFNSLQNVTIQTGSTTIAATTQIANTLQIDVSQNATLSGTSNVTAAQLNITNNVDLFTNQAGAQLSVTGTAQLNATSVDLGRQLNDVINFGLVTANNVATSWNIEENSSMLFDDVTVQSIIYRTNGDIGTLSTSLIQAQNGLTLDANGTDADLNLAGDLSGGAGPVSLTADDAITMTSTFSLTTTTGNVSLIANADAAVGDTGGILSMASGSSIDVGNATISLSSVGVGSGDISLSHLESTSAAANAVSITADQSILDATIGDPAAVAASPLLNISAINGTAQLIGKLGIGAADDIDVNVVGLRFSTDGIAQITDSFGGMNISQASNAGGGGAIAANSPLTISANVTVGASTTFTAGDSALAGDTLTINNNAIVRLTSPVAGILTFNAGDDIALQTGRIITDGGGTHEVRLRADLDNSTVGAADGDRGGITEDGTTAIVEVTTNLLTASAAVGINLDTNIDTLVATNTLNSPIIIREVNDVGVQLAQNANGNVTIIAQGSILDGDTGADDLDVSGNTVVLTATTGGIGTSSTNIFTGTAQPLEVSATVSLTATANAATGAVALDYLGANNVTLNTPTAWLVSNGDLNVSNLTLTVQNLALIADADRNGTGVLTIPNALVVPGDLRVEGADVTAGAGIDLTATRLMFVSGRAGIAPIQNEIITTRASQLDLAVTGNLTVTSILNAPVDLIDLDGDNVAVQTRSAAGSITFTANSTVTVTDDVIAGNDGTTASTGFIRLEVTGAANDLIVNDVVLTDNGNITLLAADDMFIAGALSANEPVTTDNNVIITSIAGNIDLTADADNDNNGTGGELRMTATARVVAGRSDAVDYVPGVGGAASPSIIVLGPAQPVAAAIITVKADEDATIASLESANTGNAIRVTSNFGAIIDGNGATLNLTAPFANSLVTLRALNGIGSNDPLETSVFSVDAFNRDNGAALASGSIKLEQLAIGSDLLVLRAENQANTGDVQVQVDADKLTVAGPVSTEQGDILLRSVTADVEINVPVTSVSGNISVVAGDDVLVNANITTGGGSIFVRADNVLVDGAGADGVIMADNTFMRSFAGTIRIETLNNSDIILGLLDTVDADESTGTVSLLAARSILVNAGDLNERNIDSGRLRAVAATGTIGTEDAVNNAPGINTRVQTLAAQSALGVFIQEENDLRIDAVAANTTRVNFDAADTVVADAALSDVRTTGAGHVKIVSEAGSILVTPGTNANGVGIEAGGNILLETRAPNADITTQANALIRSNNGGNITLRSADDIQLNAGVTTNANGAIVLLAANGFADAGFNGIEVFGQLNTANGNIVVDSQAAVRITADIQSTGGDVGLRSQNNFDIDQQANVSGVNVAVNASRDYVMGIAAQTTAGNNLAANAGRDILLGTVTGLRVGLRATQNIIDNNAAGLNVRANELNMLAGGRIGDEDLGVGTPVTDNANAIDIQLGRMIAAEDGILTARAGTGVYLQETSVNGSLIVDSAAALTVTVTAPTVAFSTVPGAAATVTATQAAQQDLSSLNGHVKLVTDDSQLQIRTNVTANNANVLLNTRGNNHDLIVLATGTVTSGAGHLTLIAGGAATTGSDVIINGIVRTTTGSLNVEGNSVVVEAGSTVETTAGNLRLFSSVADVRISALVSSTTGNIAVDAARDILQQANITTAGNVLERAGRDLVMATNVSTQAGTTIVVSAGRDITLGLLQAFDVGVRAIGNITDGNGALLNIRADRLTIDADGRIGNSSLASNPEVNPEAIDIQLGGLQVGVTGQLAARGLNGVYLQETTVNGLVTVRDLPAFTVTVDVQRVNFSTGTTLVSTTLTKTAQEDLIAGPGPIKFVMNNGSIVITPGLAGPAVVTTGGDLLLEARGAGNDLTINAGASVSTGAGNISLFAADVVTINASVTTTSGDINIGEMTLTPGTAISNTLNINAPLNSTTGDIRLSSLQNILLAAPIGTGGGVGILAGNNLNQLFNINAGTDVVINVGGVYTMQPGTSVSTLGTVVINVTGDLLLGFVSGDRVGLRSGGNIVDNNAAALNVRANTLSMIAGGRIGDRDQNPGDPVGPDVNRNAIDIQLGLFNGGGNGLLAAQAGSGIYLQETSLTPRIVEVTTINLFTGAFNFSRPNFNSSTTTAPQTLDQAQVIGLTSPGPIKVVADNSTLQIRSTVNSTGGVLNGDVLLEVRGAGNDLIIDPGVVVRGDGRVTLIANDLVQSSGPISAGLDVFVLATNIDINSTITAAGNVRLQATQDIDIDGDVSGNIISVAATGATSDIRQTADLNATTFVFVAAGRDYRMGPAADNRTVIATPGNAISLTAGRDMLLGGNSALRVDLVTTTGNILDNNAALVNVRADQLRAVAGGSIGTADLGNPSPNQNANAIDISLGRLAAPNVNGVIAASAPLGMYFEEVSTGFTVLVDRIEAFNANYVVERANFNSSFTQLAFNENKGALEDLRSTQGPIKFVLDDSSLVVNGGVGLDGVAIQTAAGNILLEARAAGANTDRDITVSPAAAIVSATGAISIIAVDDISLRSTVTTAGDILVDAGGSDPSAFNALNIEANITSTAGSVLVRSGANLQMFADIQATVENVGVIATGNILQNGNITAGQNAIVAAGGRLTMVDNLTLLFFATTANGVGNGTAIISAGTDIDLGVVRAVNVAITATAGSIIDANDALFVLPTTNVFATNLMMRAGNLIGAPDTLNGTPDANLRAIDTEVAVIAASAPNGIYIQEQAGDLIVDLVPQMQATVQVDRVEFRSTTSPVQESRTVLPLADLESNAGPVKVLVTGGSLILRDGDGDNVSVSARDNILLRARGADSDIRSEANAAITSTTGHVTLWADDDIRLLAGVSTGGSGSIFLNALNQTAGGSNGIELRSAVTSANGDILLSSATDISVFATITSTNADVVLIAGRNVDISATINAGRDVGVRAIGSVTQSADIVAGGNVVIDANGSINMGPANSTTSNANIVLRSGNAIVLGLLAAPNIGVTAVGNIIDGNGAATNLRGNQASIRSTAGSIGAADNNPPQDVNPSSIDLELNRIAAVASTGIFLEEVAAGGDLRIDAVPDIFATVIADINEVKFNSTQPDLLPRPTVALSTGQLEDLTTTANGTIHVVVDAGTLTVAPGAVPNAVIANGTGLVQLRAIGASSDIVILANAHIGSGTGNVLINADDDVIAAGNITTGGAATIRINANNAQQDRGPAAVDGIDLSATVQSATGTITFVSNGAIAQTAVGSLVDNNDVLLSVRSRDYTHLHNTSVGELRADTGRSGVVVLGLDSTPFQVAAANDTKFLDRLRHDASLPATERSRYDFDAKFGGNYSLFIVNSGNLRVTSIDAGRFADVVPNRPNIFVGTTGAASDLTVQGNITTRSTSNVVITAGNTGNAEVDGGVVLVAGGKLTMAAGSKIETIRANLLSQVVSNINQPTFNGNEILGSLNGNVFNGNEGVGNERTTEFVVKLGQIEEDPRSVVLQRVVTQFGVAGEKGYVTYVDYADGIIEQFDTASDVGRPVTPPRAFDPSAINAAPPALTATFTRSTPFTEKFLTENPELPTTAIIRRADDFFFFQNATSDATVQDMAVEVHEVLGVKAQAVPGNPIPLPADPVPLNQPSCRLSSAMHRC